VLPRLLIAVAPFLALYAFRQYYVLPLPEWDEVWQDEVNFETGGSPEEGRIRVWGTLNSPATFGFVMVVSALCYLTARRLTPIMLASALAVIAALALTYVRSMWAGFLVALIAIVLVSRGAALKRVAPLALVLVALAPVALSGSTQVALGERATTFGDIEGDTSAGDRGGIGLALLPVALSQPGGLGVGQSGEPTRLGGGGIHITDNGYLAAMLQVGPIGFALLIFAIGSVVRSAGRNAWWRPGGVNLLAFGAVLFVVVTLLTGDQLYGLSGMIFWYMAGLAVGRDELTEEPRG
jgi:O-antigen ligase